MSPGKFDEKKGSIASTLNLAWADPRLAKLSAINRKDYGAQAREYEAWANAGFVTGFSVSNFDDEGESGVV